MLIGAEDRGERVSLRCVRPLLRALAKIVGSFDPADVALHDALPLRKMFDRIERLAASAKTLLAAKVAGAGAWRAAGCRSPEEHLARMSGTTNSAARTTLETSKHLVSLPDTNDAMRRGDLSSAQVHAVAAAAAVAPDAEGAWNYTACGTVERGATFEAALAPISDQIFAAARAGDERESRDAYAFDALMALAQTRDAHERPARGRTKPHYLAVLPADLSALVRGDVADGEVCEIPGFGPVPVATAREVLGESILKLVITKGVGVANCRLRCWRHHRDDHEGAARALNRCSPHHDSVTSRAGGEHPYRDVVLRRSARYPRRAGEMPGCDGGREPGDSARLRRTT